MTHTPQDVAIRMIAIRRYLSEQLSRPLTQEGFAEVVGSNRGSVSVWETGRVYPPILVVKTLFERYGIDANFIYFGSYEYFKPSVVSDLSRLIDEVKAERARD